MPDAIIWICFAFALAFFAFAWYRAWVDAERRANTANLYAGSGAPPPDGKQLEALIGGPDDRIAALVVAFLFALLGVAASVVDHKVGSDDERPGDEAVSIDLSTSEEEHAAFTRIAEVHSGPLDHDLCLVRFYERSRGPAGPWWTDCGEGRSIATVGQARSRLALRKDWGDYDARATYTVPKGEDVMYIHGTVASQCTKGEKTGCKRYRGGGQQYFFPDGLDPEGDERELRCAKSKQRPPPPGARYGPCD